MSFHWMIGALAGIWLVQGQAHAAGPIQLVLVDRAPLSRLVIGEFAPGTMERGGIETQTPTVRLPVSNLQLTVDTGGDTDCGEGIDTAAALAKADVESTAAAADQCLFLAVVTLTSERGELKITGQCDDWRRGASYCWVEGDIGQFWVRRTGSSGSLQLDFGPSGPGMLPPAAVSGAVAVAAAVPQHGIMLDSVFDDAGRAVLDRWLLVPDTVVTLDLKR